MLYVHIACDIDAGSASMVVNIGMLYIIEIALTQLRDCL